MARRGLSAVVLSFLFLSFLLPSANSGAEAGSPSAQVCIVGSGIAGASVSHFLTQYSSGSVGDILVLERRHSVGGRMATITMGGDTFEAGGTILHPKNLHLVRFTSALGLRRKDQSDDSSFGIWDGSQFVFQTLKAPLWFPAPLKKLFSLVNSLRLLWRYGLSLLRMSSFVEDMLTKFLRYYEPLETRPVFETVEEMLKWSGLYGLTQNTVEEELLHSGLSSLLISELVTVIDRINYGQNVSMSGLAGSVSLAGSGGGLWGVEGGNWQVAAGLLKHSNASLHLGEEVTAISYSGGYYEVSSTKANNYSCRVVIIATPLDEQNITFTPPVYIPSRKLQHTYAIFIRGILNPEYFGLSSVSEIPDLVGTLEVSDIPFSSISILKTYSNDDFVYKVFSRRPLEDSLLDTIFSVRRETVQINWPAYPHYHAPEVFAPFLLDGKHLYYINSFESAASTIETSAVAAENIARLILSRLKKAPLDAWNLESILSRGENFHTDL